MITESLKVMLWGKEIGRLSWDSKRGISYFEYNKDFLKGDTDVFPIIASIKSPSSKRPILGDKETKIYRKLPPFLADSLPDTWGNQVFECWRIENGIRNQEITPLDILSFIGKRGMGALEFLPESSEPRSGERLNLKTLTDLAHQIFVERENVKILPSESLTLQSLIAVGTSAGGRQPKAIIAMNPETEEIRSGQIAEQEGFEYYILKFGHPDRSSAELEMAYYEMCTAAGITMMPCKLIAVEGQKHFITKRFDRNKEHKLHMQTLAALYPEADSYEKLLMVCRKMRLPESASEEIFRRMVFNLLANNTDDHNKNFSFLMDENGKWSLSPAYDMTYIFNTGGFLPESMHCLMMQGKLSGHTLEDAMTLAKENGIRKANAIINEVADAIKSFRTYAEKHDVQERWISAIETCLTKHLNEWGFSTDQPPRFDFETDGKRFENVHIEQAYKGNYHLYATIDGQKRKNIIRKGTEGHEMLNKRGLTQLTETEIRKICEQRFLDN